MISKEQKNINIPDWFYDDARNIEVSTKLLLYVIEKLKKDLPPTITYKDLANKVGYGLTPRTIDTFLGNISEVCKENNLPYISGIVVNGETQMPGVGYFHYFYGINKNDFDSQIKKFKEDYDKIVGCKYWGDLLFEIESHS